MTIAGHGGDMKRSLWIAPLLFALMSSAAFATSVSTFIGLTPNDGGGDNFVFVQQGPGFSIGAFGGTEWPFFNAFDGYEPGSTFELNVTVFFSDAFARFGGHSYELGGGPGELILSSFTFPTNGKDFSARVSAEFLGFFTLPDGQDLDVGGGAAGKITFHFVNGLYYPDDAGFVTTIVPEPGTLGMMGTGVIGILGLLRKRLPI
jgi:hypothetical protein